MLDQLRETNIEYIHIIKIGFSRKVLGAHWREWLTLLKGVRESFPERWSFELPLKHCVNGSSPDKKESRASWVCAKAHEMKKDSARH